MQIKLHGHFQLLCPFSAAGIWETHHFPPAWWREYDTASGNRIQGSSAYDE